MPLIASSRLHTVGGVGSSVVDDSVLESISDSRARKNEVGALLRVLEDVEEAKEGLR